MISQRLVVFDFDGTLYPLEDEHLAVLKESVSRSVRELSGNRWSHEAALENGLKSFYAHGLSYRSVCEEFKISMAIGHETHHRNLHLDLVPDPAQIKALEDLRDSGAAMIILTQASQEFLSRKLPMLGLETLFPAEMRLAHEDYNLAMKAHCTGPFMQAVRRARDVTGQRFHPHDVWMLEDSQQNLKIPHALGWNTVYIGRNDIPGAPHLHVQVRSLQQALQQIMSPGSATHDLTSPVIPV